MNIAIRPRPEFLSLRHIYWIVIGVFLMALISIAAPPNSAESHSLRRGAERGPFGQSARTARVSAEKARSGSGFGLSLTAPVPTGPAIESFASDCTTPATSYAVGDIVCLKVSGIPVNAFFPHRLFIGNANTTIVQSFDVTSDPQTFSFTADATTTINGIAYDNRGTWRAVVYNPFFFFPEANTSFTVDDATNPTADVGITTVSAPSALTPGSSAIFDIQVKNYGPDNSANVSLTDAIPAGTSLVSFDQLDGPTFTCTGPAGGATSGTTTCTIASFDWPGPVATFRAVYQVDNAAPLYSQISNTASIVSGPTGGTDDQNSLNNSITSTFNVVASGGSASCVLTCPDNVNAVANTTEGGQRGAHVTFDPADSTGDCGAITASPASGTFFTVGTTTVTVTSATGGGSCSFTVTVTDSGANPPTISCPASQIADADSNCSASVSVGTATTTGDNVTAFATRSDGQPVYTCDVFGNCTRNASDAPFSAGVTTITWFAYSHDVAGPYTGPVDGEGQPVNASDTEEGHRTGAASCTQTITVNDVTPPTITPPANQTGSADASCMFTIPDYTSMASVSDNCACDSNTENCVGRVTITVTQSPAPGTQVGLGATTITLTANDGSSNNNGQGNTATAQFTVTVSDTTPPTFTFVPPMVTAYTGAGATTCDTLVSDATIGTPTATDNCSSVTFSRSPAGNTFPVGDTTITWTARDATGNTTTATQIIRVIDNTPPVISCPTSQTLEPTCPSGAVATWIAPVGTDNCPGATTTQTAGLAPGSVFPIGTTTVTYTVNDAHGNSASCSFTITVKTVNQTILDMEAYVNTLPLSGTQKQGLNAKLEAARTAPNTNVACNKLNDFISQVQAFINNGTLTSAQGNALITSASHVRNTIGCTNNPCS